MNKAFRKVFLCCIRKKKQGVFCIAKKADVPNQSFGTSAFAHFGSILPYLKMPWGVWQGWGKSDGVSGMISDRQHIYEIGTAE